MKTDIAHKLRHMKTDIYTHTHTRLINPYTKLGKYKFWSRFNKVSFNFSLYTLFNCAGAKKKSPINVLRLLWLTIDD